VERKYKALQYKVKYLELELEDIEEIFDKCKQQFQKDFGDCNRKHSINSLRNDNEKIDRPNAERCVYRH